MTITTANKILLATLGLHASSLSYGQSSNYGKDLDYLSLTLEELGKIKVSIATGNNTPIEQAPAVATVITAQQIEAMGARTLDEVLETVPGLHVSISGTNRLDSIYSIRGIHTSFNPQVLLLINNTPLQSPFQGGRPTLFRQPVNSIEKIEVIRGPGSAVYGADAFSGVINIITKTAKDIAGNEIGIRSGSFDYQEAWIQTGTQHEDWGMSFTLNYQHSNGDKERTINSDFQTMLDSNSSYSTNSSLSPGSLSTRYEVVDATIAVENQNWKANIRAWESDNTGNGAGGAQALDPKSGDNYTLYTADAAFQTSDWFDGWTNSAKLNYTYYKLDSNFILLPPNTRVAISGGNIAVDPNNNLDPLPGSTIFTFTEGLIGNPNAKTEDAQIELTSTYKNLNNHQIRLSTGSRHQTIRTSETKNFGPGVISDSSPTTLDGTLTDVSGTNNIYLPDSSRTVNYLSLQDEWNIQENWKLVTGIRHDKYSDFGSTTNPRLALVWQKSEKLSTKILYGSAFRAPSFAELGFQNNPAAIGNKNLDPEKIDTYEVAFSYQPYSSFRTDLSLYYYQAKDLIEYVFTPDAGGLQAQNVRDQDGHGFEWEASWELTQNFRINTNYAWQRSEDSDSGQEIADAPQQQLTLSSFWKIAPQWLLSSQINWVADRKRAQSDARSDIDDYTLVDLTLKRQNAYKNLDVGLGIRNLFDEDAREPSDGIIADDFPLEGRSFWAELRYQF
ncbi:MAG: TonB-dependent receptor plug domain-containing protein [Cellvibrionaceae bacterium]